jgi:hypothetical protein
MNFKLLFLSDINNFVKLLCDFIAALNRNQKLLYIEWCYYQKHPVLTFPKVTDFIKENFNGLVIKVL